MERWMIVYLLPLEVWMDIFCFPWVSRKGFGQIVDKIGNFKFAEHAQFYLHEWGKHTLGRLYFESGGVSKWHNYHYQNQYQQLEYPQTEIPENIRFCKSFQIKYFDKSVFNFFRRIQSVLTAATKLSIHFAYDSEEQLNNARFIFDHLLPFMDGIHTIGMDDQLLPFVKASLREKFNKVKMLSVKFKLFEQSAIQPIMEWLTASNNEPKLLQLYCYGNEKIARQVLETIRKQFMEATEPSTIAVFISNSCDPLDFKRKNAIGEQLSGMRSEEIYGEFKVFRHQANVEAGDQLRQWVDGNMDKYGFFKWEQYIINLRRLTFGQGPIFVVPDLDEDEAYDGNEVDEDTMPSTSKKGPI